MDTSLSPLSFPIRQSRLIEASAGTGKTFTIATLYVRLVLGHGGPGERPRPMTPPEILVVTFTEAATKELRDRIRARLAQAARHFRSPPGGAPAAVEPDDPLAGLRDDYPPGQWPSCARQLELAAAWMDESAVSTIHSWCARMLREHAFDSESLFSQALELDAEQLLADVTADYWRCFLAGLDLPCARLVRDHWWTGPAALMPQVKPLLRLVDALDAGQPPQDLLEARLASCAALKGAVRAVLGSLRQCIDDAVAARTVDRRRLQSRYYAPWFDQLQAWVDDPHLLRPALSDSAWARLSVTGMGEAIGSGRPDHPLHTHPALAPLAEVRRMADALAGDRRAALQHAAHWISERMESQKRSRALMGPDDLLTRLHAALRGPGGERLAQAIRKQFPVAFIDEFQDTDPIQYGIFDAVYRLEQADPGTAVVLIGDPKQAIYSFRGADIHAYLAARRACGERLHTLQRNFRSTAQAVEATNWVFDTAQAGDARGAFRATAAHSRIAFEGALARGRKDALWVAGGVQTALTVWCLEDPAGGQAVAVGSARDTQAAAAASEIVRLLELARIGHAGFRQGEAGPLQALQPSDIAVLVSTGIEAAAVRRALAQRGLRSVYLSDRDSVYDSTQAAELETWLSACADPEDAARVRAALATPSMGLGWADLDALNHDEHAWDAAAGRFLGYRTVWREQGVLPMLRRLLHDHGIPARLLAGATNAAGDSGERALTNLLHLAELLQTAAQSVDGEHALVRHLARQRTQPGSSAGDDARQIRLESDAGLVQVVTVFKSKGLEYPLVFLPFSEYARPVDADDGPVKWHDDAGSLHVSLAPDAQQLGRADEERQAEDLRRLYVALTRARYATWMGVSAVRQIAITAVGHLVGLVPAAAGEATVGLAAQLQDRWGACQQIRVLPVPEPGAERYSGPAQADAAHAARTSVRVHREHWWIASYSALTRVLEAGEPLTGDTEGPDTAHHENFSQMAAEGAALPSSRGGAPSIHSFPAGAREGSFLHEVLEWAAQQGFGAVVRERAPLRDMLARRCSLRGWSPWVDALTDWVQDFLSCRFALPARHGVAPTTLCLAALDTPRSELEFWLPVHQASMGVVDAQVRAQTLEARPRALLQPSHLNGMLKGFIDLVFEHEGRYYVADYKSNRLGDDDAAYTSEAMEAEVLASRYDLQYVLYLLALHRLLASRLPGYDYDRHIGGAVYFFLRGSASPGQGLHVEKPPRSLIEALDRLFAQGSGTGGDPDGGQASPGRAAPARSREGRPVQ